MRKSSWSASGRVPGRRSLLAAVAGVAALLAVPSLSGAADEVFQANLGWLVVNGGPLVSFDIGWVDTNLNEYFVADRSNLSVDAIPIMANPPSFAIKPTGQNAFAGNVLCPDGAANDCAGPNGILTFTDLNNVPELWVGDGPTVNPACPSATPCSTVKVFIGLSATLSHTISTATGAGFPGAKRADELCFAPKNTGGSGPHPGRILIANDADAPPYITFIDTDGTNAFKVVKQISFPQATGGIEQCQFDPNSGNFFLNLPEDSGKGGDGAVYIFDPTTMNQVGSPFDISMATCVHPQGMAINPNPNPSQILLGCNGATTGGSLDSVVIKASDGSTVKQLTNEGGADAVWFEPVSQHFFLAEGGCTALCGVNKQGVEQLGIFDGHSIVSDPFGAGGQDVFVGFAGSTTRRAHSVAAWSGTLSGLPGTWTIAFVPVPAVGGGTAPFSSTLCGTAAAQGCIGLLAVTPIPNATTVEALE